MGLNGIFVMCDTLMSHGWWIFNEMFSFCAAAFVSPKLIFGWKETSKKMCKWKERAEFTLPDSALRGDKAQSFGGRIYYFGFGTCSAAAITTAAIPFCGSRAKLTSVTIRHKRRTKLKKSKDEEEKWNSNHWFMCWTLLNLQRGGGARDDGECARKCLNICTKHT